MTDTTYLDAALKAFPEYVKKLQSIGHIDMKTLRVVPTNRGAIKREAVRTYVRTRNFNCRCTLLFDKVGVSAAQFKKAFSFDHGVDEGTEDEHAVTWFDEAGDIDLNRWKQLHPRYKASAYQGEFKTHQMPSTNPMKVRGALTLPRNVGKTHEPVKVWGYYRRWGCAPGFVLDQTTSQLHEITAITRSPDPKSLLITLVFGKSGKNSVTVDRDFIVYVPKGGQS